MPLVPYGSFLWGLGEEGVLTAAPSATCSVLSLLGTPLPFTVSMNRMLSRGVWI